MGAAVAKAKAKSRKSRVQSPEPAGPGMFGRGLGVAGKPDPDLVQQFRRQFSERLEWLWKGWQAGAIDLSEEDGGLIDDTHQGKPLDENDVRELVHLIQDHAREIDELDLPGDELDLPGSLSAGDRVGDAAGTPGGAMEGGYRWVRIADIKIGEGRRPCDPAKVEALAASIRDVRLHHPIGVTPDLVLVHGLHRLRACESLGWETIPATTTGYTPEAAELVEIDENLQRAGLTALEEAQALARRKELYERLHPEAKRGAKGGRKKKSPESRVESPEPEPAKELDRKAQSNSFAKDTAAKTGKHPASIARDAAIGKRIAPDVAKTIAKTPLAKNKKELAKLAKLEPEEQRVVARTIAAGEAKSVTEAIAEPEPSPEPPEPVAGEWLAEELGRLRDDWIALYRDQALPALGAAVLESTAAKWLAGEGFPKRRK